ncbi:MAG TPA: multiheme c-type cytochrome [Polyangiaceae bacterium]|nr:multiheme c-type cytochrome [Polyangiaceae bacterium]
MIAATVGAASTACGPHATEVADASTTLSRETLMDPATCGGCHPAQYQAWQQSMHALASDDPVFVAMNARGQRDTGGRLGTFCATCHAPMAVGDSVTTDGLNLSTLVAGYRGVTCFFCHTVNQVTGTHDGAVALADDLVMRGEYDNPIPSAAHGAEYSVLHDGEQSASAGFCGACHDVVVPQTDAAVERTFTEWSHSAFAGSGGATCIECHMTASPQAGPIADVGGVPDRTLHDHRLAAVDVPFAGSFVDAGTDAVVDELSGALQGALCVTGAGGIRVVLDPVGIGHGWPSGATQDRRAWTEVVASTGGTVFYQSGVVPPDVAVGEENGDPDLWLLRDCMVDANGDPVDMLWQAAASAGNELPALATFDMLDPAFYMSHVFQRFPNDGSPLSQYPDEVTLRVRLQPIGLDVLADLEGSGDLDAAAVASMPTFDVSLTGPGGADLTWTPQAAASLTYLSDDGTPATCVATEGFNIAATKVLAGPACGGLASALHPSSASPSP